MSEVTCICAIQVGHNTHEDQGWRPEPPGGPGAHRRYFLALMMDVPRSTASTPPRGSTIDICYVDGGRSRISVSTPRGGAVDVCYIDGGCSQTSGNTSQGARCRCFLALMMDAIGSTAPAPPRGPAVDVCYVDGGRSRISSVSTS
jgi:hypothetical protein